MNIPLAFDLAEYHDRCVEKIAEFFAADVEVVAAYPCFEETIPKVAITLELDGIFPENPDDMGTEQFHGDVRFAAYVFVSFLHEDPKLIVRKLGARLLTFIYGNRFGCPVGPAKIISAQPDALSLPGSSKDAEDYEVWRVEWSHEAFFGESVWNDDRVAGPIEVWVGAETVEAPDGEPYTDGTGEPFFTGGEKIV